MRVNTVSPDPFLHPARWPVADHLKPAPRRQIFTEADVPADLLRLFPGLVDELNLVPVDAFVGCGKPGPGWANWTAGHIGLDMAINLPVAGES